MRAEKAWGARWRSCAHPLAHRFMETAAEKETLVVLAADLGTVDELVRLIHQVGGHIAALKTHVDTIEDFSPENWQNVVDAAQSHDLMLFEDRKFADIGKVSLTQMSGVYDIRSWADLVTAHSVSGPDIIDGIAAGWDEVKRVGGIFLLAQMSSRGNLLSDDYTAETIATGTASPHVLGYIGNGSSPEEVASLRVRVGVGRMIWTPGVNLSATEGALGQRYGHPTDAIKAGADAIIVGSGIHGSDDPGAAAATYAEVSWSALLER
ncbi:MAG: orotidine-5'-phosphate decarboxylase [Candidatus Thalassarchaeum betae]|uniref:orotidine-5'-phosphate decarboxylase n=1 Tax=Candidatus Thalassarchaeum betae TaxID=2599289 RepID=A0A2V3HTY1_9ARCH|nr:MAG: orotidine-5'-phosphate decarboxylase [Candidatus Thalassoarchaea betae]PXF27162.1 MAG: orotidine-5'-phosphate decarboxylase [Euryarchaeota archaeon]HIC50006.1 orotidine-5'-phosphate decarboxylase [Candidatus Poseidoniales archaeon]HIM13033.1 orotidine-5'-phosphate decarboxylase [Candidatus Poseidoniales archaeon]HIM92719.1 orotidine-5'-phosphate decarboxylase [Candidatus Poseidoniales archaeon]